ncbi:MAG: RNA 2',3'-cyclic phosphodiesterase [Thermoprotei archaeon]|nr:MAG: RNA 2',3'-cyclic phosphodiesterase [Thermoprotei archaeon]RLF03603.1 MAG: RNA 2',3'-cyclic phosphodiesterase [Thermoprotei archaeon]
MERVRSFIAVDILEPSILDKIESLQRDLMSLGATLKPVERENIHITLYFLGEISLSLVEEVKKVLRSVVYEPFTIMLEGLGAFPSPGNPRVVWIGVSRGAKELREVYEMIMAKLRKLGFRPDPRGFSPHVTVARVKSKNRGQLPRYIMTHTSLVFGSMRVESIRLKKSILTSRGPIYETLYEKMLGK